MSAATLPLAVAVVLIGSTAGQLSAAQVLLYAPELDLERTEVETLTRARLSVDVAMYSFTDTEIAEELCRLARNGLKVRVYRDAAQLEMEK